MNQKKIEARIDEAAANKARAKLRAVRIAASEQVVREQQAAQERCNGCGRHDPLGSMERGRWYCQRCRRWDDGPVDEVRS